MNQDEGPKHMSYEEVPKRSEDTLEKAQRAVRVHLQFFRGHVAEEQTLDSYQVANQERVSVNMKISLVLVCFHSGIHLSWKVGGPPFQGACHRRLWVGVPPLGACGTEETV